MKKKKKKPDGVMCSAMFRCLKASPDAKRMSCHSLGLPSLQNCELNKALFLINYPVSGILVQQKKKKSLTWHHILGSWVEFGADTLKLVHPV
jgi:hypothetical protein